MHGQIIFHAAQQYLFRCERMSQKITSGARRVSQKFGKPVLSDFLSGDGFFVSYPHKPRDIPSGSLLLPGGIRTGLSSIMQILEITDNEDRPLMCMPPDAVLRQKLHRRIVCIALHTGKNTLLLHKRTDPMLAHQGVWDLYTGPVLMGEAREDAALRLLQDKTGLEDFSLTFAAVRKGRREEPSHVALFIARLPRGMFPQGDQHDILEVDADELAGLVRHTPELFSPALQWAAESGCLFRKKGPRSAARTAGA